MGKAANTAIGTQDGAHHNSTVWCQGKVHRLELAIAHRLPQVEEVDRLVVLRQIKRMGRLLDESGRPVAYRRLGGQAEVE